MPCVYVGVDDYRCGSAKGSRLHFRTISNEEGRQHLEKYCDTLAKTTTSQCTVRVVFVYAVTSGLSDNSEVLRLSRRRVTKAKFLRYDASNYVQTFLCFLENSITRSRKDVSSLKA